MSSEEEAADLEGDGDNLTHIPVEVQDDFLKQQTSARPIKALSELIGTPSMATRRG